LKAWKWMTGYDSFEAAYEMKMRQACSQMRGFRGEYDPWRVSEGLDEDDYTQTTRPMGDVSVYSSHF
jgi:hypothetical protein